MVFGKPVLSLRERLLADAGAQVILTADLFDDGMTFSGRVCPLADPALYSFLTA